MNQDLPKVLVPFRGKPMITHVLENSEPVTPGKTVIIVGYQKEKVIETTKDFYPKYVTQKQQIGTGHAVLCTEELFKESEEDILVLMGDCPLMSQTLLENFIEFHKQGNYTASLISKDAIDPGGCGRIIRYQDGSFRACVEKKDLSPDQLDVNEINVGTYICNSKKLFETLHKITNNNTQNEYYLTDVFNMVDNLGIFKASYFEIPEYFTFNTQEELRFGSYYFRRFGEYDFDDFKEMYPMITKDSFRIFMQHKRGNVYVVSDNGKIIATITFILEMKLARCHKNALHIEDVMVHPNYRKQGIGSYLLFQSKVYARNHYCYKIILNCNESIIGFYESAGFSSKNIEMSLYT
tara:strand:- start:2422 stop:3474 length:1053 start_codon:yes stop_codon:yes gene_type:complete